MTPANDIKQAEMLFGISACFYRKTGALGFNNKPIDDPKYSQLSIRPSFQPLMI